MPNCAIVRDRFVLFDLNSSGGTFVNGQRTDQSILYPGDVISLAGVTLIFGQDLTHRARSQRRPDRTRLIQFRSTAPPPSSKKINDNNEMSGPVVFVLRLLLTVSLYAFLVWAFTNLWRDIKLQSALLAARKIPPITSELSTDADQVHKFAVSSRPK